MYDFIFLGIVAGLFVAFSVGLRNVFDRKLIAVEAQQLDRVI